MIACWAALDRKRPDASDFHEPAGRFRRMLVEHFGRIMLKGVDKGHDCFPGKVGPKRLQCLFTADKRCRHTALLYGERKPEPTTILYTIWPSAACRRARKSDVGQAVEDAKTKNLRITACDLL